VEGWFFKGSRHPGGEPHIPAAPQFAVRPEPDASQLLKGTSSAEQLVIEIDSNRRFAFLEEAGLSTTLLNFDRGHNQPP